jgi:hypothetical protein
VYSLHTFVVFPSLSCYHSLLSLLACQMRLRLKAAFWTFLWFLPFALKTTVYFFHVNNEVIHQNPVPSLDEFTRGTQPRCALLFFGLPRGYERIVLPSAVKNVLIPNSKYNCDVYAHSMTVQKEEAGRSGRGGTIDFNSIFLLEDRVREVAANFTGRIPHVAITIDSEEHFWKTHKAEIQKFRDTKDVDGSLLYFPWLTNSYQYPISMDNMVKQWHSIETVWHLMEEESKRLHVSYDRIAMLRSDVFYATPIDIYQTNKTHTSNRDAVLPGFAMYPVNDRMIYGPYDAVKIWATERFQRIDDHVQKVQPGIGMHSERFLNGSILPAIRESGTKVVINPDICFFRVRADETIWISDCDRSLDNVTVPEGIGRGFRKVNKKKLVEDIVGLPCHRSKYSGRIFQVDCRKI